ncbi:MAG: hypothetical protein C4B56_08570 [Candidatus Methanophagaceae archaeon]|nr:MAG: hypothetical protein C4B56_08570 [Methanophagales archaeon]
MKEKIGVQSATATNTLLVLFALLAVLFVPTSAKEPLPTSTPTPAPTPTPVPEFTIIALPVALVLTLVLLFFLKMQRRVEK